MSFSIQQEAESPVDDDELERVLNRVYVEGGFTAPEVGAEVFLADVVRKRGDLMVATAPSGLLGTVIVVAPASQGRRFAEQDECELHLLAVTPEARGRGIGRALVRAAVHHATTAHGAPTMLLWSQPEMVTAQRIYRAEGFTRVPSRDFTRGGRTFEFFERRCPVSRVDGRGRERGQERNARNSAESSR